MKKLLFLGAGVLLIVLCMVLVFSKLSLVKVFDSISVKKVDIDVKEDISLDLKNATVSIDEWGKDYVELSYDNMFGKRQKLDVIIEGNMITLNSKLDYSDFKHLHIKVPKGIVNIVADVIDAKGGTYKSVACKKAYFRNCSMVDKYILHGVELELRECKLSGKGEIINRIINIRETDANKLTLTPINTGSSIEANIRELSAKELLFNSKECSSLDIELKNPDLEDFIVNYKGNVGRIAIISGHINNVKNNSDIEISYKQSAIN